MSNFEHESILKKLVAMGERPDDEPAYREWVQASQPIKLLRDNEFDAQVIVYASTMPHILIQAVALPNRLLAPPDWDSLAGWSGNPFKSSAYYCSSGNSETVYIDRECSVLGSRYANDVIRLVFGRHFHGLTGDDATYFEILQEYVHLSGIHWRPERHAYCRFDNNGDFEPIISVSGKEDANVGATLITFQRDCLEDYLAATDSSLVRLFDFTMFKPGSFNGWGAAEESLHHGDSLRYTQKVDGDHAGYIHGVQICRPSHTREQILRRIAEPAWNRHFKEYAKFVAYDWRNRKVSEISTDPSATTNYFESENNNLPFELSPAFFRPEVLTKYKADRDKYTLTERDLACRSAWHLTGIDVNEAGQVHAYIRYLRDLPYSEQLYWQSYNEPPRTSISKRSFTTDFEGQFDLEPNPLRMILTITDRWSKESVKWWARRDPELSKRVNVPVTSSLDEWANACMDFAKLVIEGFEITGIRSELDRRGIKYLGDWKSLALLDALLSGGVPQGPSNLPGLRSIQEVRSKVKGHVGGREAKRISTAALTAHRSYAAHFMAVCDQVQGELKAIESCFINGDQGA